MNYNLLHLLSKPSTIDELVVRVRKLPGILPLKSSGRKPIYNAIYRTLREARDMGLVECQKTSHRHIWSRTNTPIPVPQKAEQAELQFNKPKPRTMRKALMELRKDGPSNPKYGICFNVNKLLNRLGVYDDLMEIAARWPKATDCLSYPIPNVSRELWVGEAGALRYELIDFMIKELEQDANETS